MEVFDVKISDLKNYIHDKVCVYRENNMTIGGDYVDIYKGFIQEAPFHILDMEVRNIGAKRKGIVDIRVE